MRGIHHRWKRTFFWGATVSCTMLTRMIAAQCLNEVLMNRDVAEEEFGDVIQDLIHHRTLRGKFSSVHPALRREGIIRVEVGKEGLHFVQDSGGCCWNYSVWDIKKNRNHFIQVRVPWKQGVVSLVRRGTTMRRTLTRKNFWDGQLICRWNAGNDLVAELCKQKLFTTRIYNEEALLTSHVYVW